MKYQFEGHDWEVVIPEKYVGEFKTALQVGILESFVTSLPPFKNVAKESKFLPLLSGLISPNTYTVSSLDMALMEMMSKGMTLVNETNLLLYLVMKIKEMELEAKLLRPADPEPEFKSSLLL